MRYVPAGYSGRPGLMHEHRRETLTHIAILAGFRASLPLPDGTVPDICQIDLSTGALFIGDAKDSESPRDAGALRRLERYLYWLRRDCGVRPDVFAVIHPYVHFGEWSPVLAQLAHVVGIEAAVRATPFSPHTALTWLECYGSGAEAQTAARQHAAHFGRGALQMARP